jgi:hypothetical protein
MAAHMREPSLHHRLGHGGDELKRLGHTPMGHIHTAVGAAAAGTAAATGKTRRMSVLGRQQASTLCAWLHAKQRAAVKSGIPTAAAGT